MTSRVLLIDSRDSFTHNVAQLARECGADVEVHDANAVHATDVLNLSPALVIIGPGPRGPAELSHLVELVRGLDGRVPLFGVCLGLQIVVRARGGAVSRAAFPVHGKRWPIEHDDEGCLRGLPRPLWVMRYHSLCATRDVPRNLRVTARDELGQPMAVFDDDNNVEAVQFHPESIGTAGGAHMMAAVLRRAGIDAVIPTRAGSVAGLLSTGPRFDVDGVASLTS